MLNTYYIIYGITVLAYLWYRFFFRFLWELKRKYFGFMLKDYPYSVVVPVYNEKPELLEECIKSLIDSAGTKEIIVVDDGSNNNCMEILAPYLKKGKIRVFLQSNKGKRYAQKLGIENARFPYIVTVDSDSVVETYSIQRLIQVFENPKIGAATGRIKALNRNRNWLTKMTEAFYLNASFFGRASLSSFNVVTCCSGALAAYRGDVIKPLMDKYVHQRFLGVECSFGDDRYLTNLVLMNNYGTSYVDEAVVYTEVPETFSKFWRQQLRWRTSMIRENIICLSFAWKRSFILCLESFWNLFIPYFSLPARVFVLVLLIYYPWEIFSFLLGILTVGIIRNLLLAFEDRKSFIYSLLYVFVSEFILYWLYFIALFQLKGKSWGTR